jgi:hypothetical protein
MPSAKLYWMSWRPLRAGVNICKGVTLRTIQLYLEMALKFKGCKISFFWLKKSMFQNSLFRGATTLRSMTLSIITLRKLSITFVWSSVPIRPILSISDDEQFRFCSFYIFQTHVQNINFGLFKFEFESEIAKFRYRS